MDSIFVKYQDRRVGRLICNSGGTYYFEYDRDFLQNGFSISPFYLPLQSGVFTAKRDPFDGLFGVFSDCLPDGWGHYLTDRELRAQGINPNSLNYIDRLAIVGDSGIGALSFEPVRSLASSKKLKTLEQIAAEVKSVLQSNETENLTDLFVRGGSSGGARPKVFWNEDDSDWIVKFPASVDPASIGEIEYRYSIAAKKCGIHMPETRLFDGKFFGVKRFDILDTDQRIHVHSAGGLLQASHRYPSLDYQDLLKACYALTKKYSEVLKLFRQMVFNVLCHNKDDHVRNFSFVFKNKEWLLSPAYDMVYSHGLNDEHSCAIRGNGNPERSDLIACGTELGLDLKQVQTIYDEIWENTKELRIEIGDFKF